MTISKQEAIKLLLENGFEQEEIERIKSIKELRATAAQFQNESGKGEAALEALVNIETNKETQAQELPSKTVENIPVEEEKVEEKDWYYEMRVNEDEILALLRPSEMVNGNPKVCGLQRITPKIIGPILSSKSSLIVPPMDSNGGIAIAEHTIIFACKNPHFGAVDNKLEITAIADLLPKVNADSKFSMYPSAWATTRAEGRALRKALKLSVIVDEEKSDIPIDKAATGGEIQPTQVAAIEKLAGKTNVDIVKMILVEFDGISSVENLSHGQAVTMIKQLNKYVDKPKLIAESILMGSNE